MAINRTVAPQQTTTPTAAPARPRSPARSTPAATLRVSGPPAVRLRSGGAATGPVPAAVESVVRTPGAGAPIPADTLQAINRSFDTDLSDVQVHTGGAAAQSADQLGARAFTYGSHIFLGSAEQPSDLRLMAHEAAHVVQQQAAPLVQTYSSGTTDRFEAEANQAAATVAQGGHASIQERTSGATVQQSEILEGGIAWIREQVMERLERHASELMPILRQGVLEWLKARLGGVLQGLMNSLSGPIRSVRDIATAVRSHFNNLVGWLRDAAGKLARNDCGPIVEAAGKIQEVFEGLAAPVVERVKEYAARLKSFFQSLWDRFGAPVWNLLRQIGGAIWEQIQRVGNWIWEKTQPIRDFLNRAWVWFKNWLGIGEGEEGQNGVLQWFQRKASAAWEWIAERIAPFKRHLLVIVGILALLSPAGPLIVAGAAIAGILRGVQWIRQNLRSRDGVVRQQSFLRGTLLPGILNTLAGASRVVGAIAGRIGGALSRADATITAMSAAVAEIPLLSFASGLIGQIAGGIRGLLGWAGEGLQTFAGWIQNGLERLGGFARRLTNALEEFLRVTRDYFRIAGGFFRRIWNAVPACVRDPFVDYFVPLILRNLPFFRALGESPEAWQQTRAQITQIVTQVFENFDLMGAIRTVFRLVLRILRVPVDLVGQLLAKAAMAWDLVIAAPLRFIENSLRAILRGIGRFMLNILSHLGYGIQGWLLNAVGERGLTLPSGLGDWRGWFNLVLDVLGLSVDHVIDLIDRRFPGAGRRLRQMRDTLSGALEWLRIALTEGPRGLWNHLVDHLSNLANSVIEAAIGWVMERVVAIISARLSALAASAGLSGVLEALYAVYQAIQTAMEYARRIIQMLIDVFDGVIQIANGVIDPAAETLERAFRRAMPVVIGFLANYAGLGGIGGRIREIILDVRQQIDNAILNLIDRAAGAIRSVLNAVRAGVRAVVGWWQARKQFRSVNGEQHTIYFEGRESAAELMMASNPTRYRNFIAAVPVPPGNSTMQTHKHSALAIAEQIDNLRRRPPGSGTQAPEIIDLLNQLAIHTAFLADATPANPPSVIEYGPLTAEGGATQVTASILSRNHVSGTTPRDQPTIWLMANRRRNAFVRGHLLNEHLGGPGRAYNLTPITIMTNNNHKSLVETFVKAAVLNNGDVVRYRIRAVEAPHPTRSFQRTLQSRIGTPNEQSGDTQKLAIITYEQTNLPRALENEWSILEYRNAAWAVKEQKQAFSIPNNLPDGDFDL